MLKRAFSFLMITIFLISTVTVAFNIQTAKAASETIIDTEVGESRFTTYPQRQSPYYWVHVQNHDTFYTRAYGNNFWYTLCGADGHGQPLYYGTWQASLPSSGTYEVFVWIPNPDAFQYDGRTYTPTQSAIYQIYYSGGMTVKTVNQRLRTGGWYSLGSYTFGTSASVILNDRTGETYLSTMLAFDAIKFVGEDVNHAPYEPFNPSPYPHESGILVTKDLSWSGGDPDGDQVTYDVYFGLSSSPPLVSSGQSATTYNPSLSYSTIYYWKIVSRDEHGLSTGGPVWDFSTQSSPSNQPPTLYNGYVSPSSGDTSTTFSYYVTYSDPEGDAPTTKYVYIDGSLNTMAKISGDYVSGAVFKYPTTLSAGSHNYYFYFKDRVDGCTIRLPLSDTYIGPNVSPPPTPDFSISAPPTSLSIQQGSSGSSTITVTSINGFNQPVQLSVSGTPSGVTATLIPSQVIPPAGGTATSALTVSVATTATPGSYTSIVTGTSGALTHNTYVSMEITVPLPTYVRGIDVSDDINWVQVYNAGYRFAFVKATEGINWKKDGFEKRVDDAKEAGLFVGVYHFARPVPNKEGAKDEAVSFVRLAGHYLEEGYLRPVLDVEDNDYGEYPEQLGKEILAQWIKTWMGTVKSMTRVEPILYMNPYLFQFLSDSSIADQYDIWIPDLRAAEPAYGDSPNTKGWEAWAFWQYKVNVVLAGGTADLDVFNGDISKLQTFVIGSGDHIPPQADAFDVNPRSITLGQSFTISYSVSDNVGLAWIELWRTVDSNGKPDGSKWEKLSTKYITGKSFSGSFTDSPSSTGGCWYGIHVGDTAGNWATEKVPISATTCMLIIVALCPVDLVVTDPNGLAVSKALNEILGASYIEFDINGDGDLDDVVTIFHRKLGNYSIEVIPEPEASPTDTFTLKVSTQAETIILAESVTVSEIPSEPYVFESKPALYTFSIVWGEETFVVSAESNSTVSDFAFSQPDKAISFDVTGSADTIGFCNVTIPKALLRGPWTVLTDGASVPLTMTENATHSCLYFTYAHSTHEVQIIGTWAIESLPTYSLTITTTAGGTADPLLGTYTYTANSSVQVTAIPSEGYSFDHWEVDTINVGSANPYTVLMDGNHTLKAVFVYSNPLYGVGDINKDGIVDIFDLVTVVIAFGSTPSIPSWDARCDLNGDSVIDVLDLAIVAIGFGKQQTPP